MKFQKVPVDRVNPAPYNPRKDLQPGDPEYEKLKLSIEQFGCVEPLVWNKRTGNLVGGHQRFKILLSGGSTDVDVSVVDLSPEKEKALNIALNKISGDPTHSYQHPTQKPLELAERAIRNSTRGGNIVLDTFLGSGTTLIAAEKTGRKCFGLEIDPHYCDVIVRRYIAFVGEHSALPELVKRYRAAKRKPTAAATSRRCRRRCGRT